MRYLDCLDFGTMNVAPSHPRVLVWRGNMINTFSDLDRKGGRQFGKKQLKETWPPGQNLNVMILFCSFRKYNGCYIFVMSLFVFVFFVRSLVNVLS